MNNFFSKKLSTIFFIFIPIIFLWHPSWLGFFGVQPYWPLFWLLPWSMINESKIRPKNKPNINPLIDPLIIDQGNNQNKGQYGWLPKNPSQFGCHKKIIGINIKKISGNFFDKNLFIYF